MAEPLPPLSQHDSPLSLVRESFRKCTGEEAEHVIFAPGRVNLIGEHTDYNGGFVLPMAINLGVYVAARTRSDNHVRVWSPQIDGEAAEFENVSSISKGHPAWSNYIRGVWSGLHEAGVAVPGFDAVIYANLPAGGGLSSSAALEVAFATLGEVLSGKSLEAKSKALLCQKAEHDFADTPCGIMDQFAVVFGRANHLLLIDCQSLTCAPVPIASSDVAFLVINTMVKHELNDGGYKSRRDDCFEAARILGITELRDSSPGQVDAARELLGDQLYRRAHHVVTEDERTLKAVAALKVGDWETLGALMYASHESLRDDFEVSCTELDFVVEASRKIGVAGGVYGARMTGGGFGGCCIALVKADAVNAVSAAISEDYHVATGKIPSVFVTFPSDGPSVLVNI